MCLDVLAWEGKFESRVIEDGSQVCLDVLAREGKFESRVIEDGSQVGAGAHA